VERVDASVLFLIHCKNFCKCHNVPPPSTIKKEKKKKENEVHITLSQCKKTPLEEQAKLSKIDFLYDFLLFSIIDRHHYLV
jgi:hypothetical protein